MPNLALIIPAAGTGSRMQAEIPKPFLELLGKPILYHTLKVFQNWDGLKCVIVAASKEYRAASGRILKDVGFNCETLLTVAGGTERQNSVINALNAVPENCDYVAIHDAVRPFVTSEEMNRCFDVAQKKGAAILGSKIVDTLKRVADDSLVATTVDRSEIWAACTPQIFKKKLLVEAYQKVISDGVSITDDASAVEYFGAPVYLVPGSARNKKLTYPFDLEYAEWMLQQSSKYV